MSTNLHDTEKFLLDHIPLARAMGVKLEDRSKGGLILSAPLETNSNHLGSAFGGSISALATLAGYALLWLELGDPNAHIVIRSSAVSYESPLHGDLRAICLQPDEQALATFRAHFKKAGKARIFLSVHLTDGETTHARFEGEYVAIR
ncbi:MAG: YiiD C-terminal domain-containing protein [Luteolibacter sp.]